MSGISILILTGQSGSGKSTAIRTLEDGGHFCVDNMPVSLVQELVQLVERQAVARRLALVMDIRERGFIEEAPAVVERLRHQYPLTRVVYLAAKEESVVRRYSETRRVHPLDRGQGLRHAIAREQQILAPLRELADETLDTSDLTPHELRDLVNRKLAGVEPGDALKVALVSFGFKHGLPFEADIVLDVRFLPNPYFIPRMREQTGLDAEVSTYVLQSPEADEFLNKAVDLLSFLIPHYQREGKRYLTVAIGCTGGQHRSVAISEELQSRLACQQIGVDTRHRDREEGPA